jgi:hypothetical protein
MKQEISKADLTCPVSQQLFFNPVSLPCKHVLEGESAQNLSSCPSCRAEYKQTDCSFSSETANVVKAYLEKNTEEYKELYFSISLFSAELLKDKEELRLDWLEKHLEKSDISADVAYSVAGVLETSTKTLNDSVETKLSFWRAFYRGEKTLDDKTEKEITAFSALSDTAEGCQILSELYKNQKFVVSNPKTYVDSSKLLSFEQGHDLFYVLCKEKKFTLDFDQYDQFKWMVGNTVRHKLILKLCTENLITLSQKFIDDTDVLSKLLSSHEGALLVSLLFQIYQVTSKEKLLLPITDGIHKGLTVFCLLSLHAENHKFLLELSEDTLVEILEAKIEEGIFEKCTVFQWLLSKESLINDDDDDDDDSDFLIRLSEKLDFRDSKINSMLVTPFASGMYAGFPPYYLLLQSRVHYLFQLIKDKIISIELSQRLKLDVGSMTLFECLLREEDVFVLLYNLYAETETRFEFSDAIMDFLKSPTKTARELPGFLNFAASEWGRTFLKNLMISESIIFDESVLLKQSPSVNRSSLGILVSEVGLHAWLLEMHTANLFSLSPKALDQSIGNNLGSYSKYLSESPEGCELLNQIDHTSQSTKPDKQQNNPIEGIFTWMSEEKRLLKRGPDDSPEEPPKKKTEPNFRNSFQ